MYFNRFDDDAHIWIYGFDRTMSARVYEIVEQELQQFTASWKSHGKKVDGDYMVLHNRFVILAVSRESFVSGCSIDSSVRVFKKLRENLGLDGLNVNLVYHRGERGIESQSRIDFQKALDAGQIKPETVVFDTTIQSLRDLREGKFEQKITESWHAGYFSGNSTDSV